MEILFVDQEQKDWSRNRAWTRNMAIKWTLSRPWKKEQLSWKTNSLRFWLNPVGAYTKNQLWLIQIFEGEWMLLLWHVPVPLADSGGAGSVQRPSTGTAWHRLARRLTERLLGVIPVQKESSCGKTMFRNQGARCKRMVFFCRCRLVAESEFGALWNRKNNFCLKKYTITVYCFEYFNILADTLI